MQSTDHPQSDHPLIDGPYAFQDLDELQMLFEFLQGRGIRHVLTVGVKFGGVEWRMARTLPEGVRITGVEIAPAPELRNNIEDIPNFELIEADSQELTADDLGRYDFAFLDGRHDYRAAKNDFLLAKACGCKLIAIHDVAHPKFPKAQVLWAELTSKYKSALFLGTCKRFGPPGIGLIFP